MSNLDYEIKVDNTELVEQEFAKAVAECLEAIGMKVEEYASDLCPVGTEESTGIKGYKGGSLLSTIRHERISEDTVAIKAGGKQGLYKFVNYATYVELGTSKMKAKPFMKPAIENHMSELKEIVERAFKG